MTPGGLPALHYSHTYTGSREGTPSLTTGRSYPTSSLGNYAALRYPSDQPSSDQSSSAPPTPRDARSIILNEPTIHAISSLPGRTPTPAVGSDTNYFDYSEQYDPVGKHVMQLYHETTSEPIPLGFVQRIKTILEEHAIAEQTALLQVPVSKLVELPAEGEIHELPATPVSAPALKRITRELILANLDVTLDSQASVTPTVNQVLSSIAETPTINANDTKTSHRLSVRPPPDHQSQSSIASDARTNDSTSTMDTASLDFALPLHYQMRSTMSLEAYMRSDATEEIAVQSPEGPTEPVTIATAELEVAAPTPTHPSQLSWTPRFEPPLDLSRPQSAFMASSVYSSSHKEVTGRFSTPPATRKDWPMKEESSMSRNLQSSQTRPASTSTTMSQGTTRPMSHPQRLSSSTSLAQRVQEAHHARRVSDSLRVYGSSAPQHAHRLSNELPVPAITEPHHTKHESFSYQIHEPTSIAHTQSSSDATAAYLSSNQARIHAARQSFAFSSARCAPSGNAPAELPASVPKYNASPVSAMSETQRRASIAAYSSPSSPLEVEDRDVPRPDSMTTTQYSNAWSYRKPVPKRSSSPISSNARNNWKEYDSTKEQDLDSSTTDLRFSAFRTLNLPLDDVKEEPNLERSSVDLRSSTFRFPLPQRKSSLAHFESVRLSRETRRNDSQHSSQPSYAEREFPLQYKSRPASGYPPSSRDSVFPPASGASLADIRSIPSLNFSRVNLFEKLNDALDHRRTSYCDEFPKFDPSATGRPVSTGLMREKYKSFFQTLDGMTCDNIQVEPDIPKADLSRALASPRVSARLRPMSAEEYIAELDRITIPSVKGLTERLSELLPSLKRYYGEGGDVIYEDDETVRTAIEEIRRLGHAALADFADDEEHTALIRNGVIGALLESPPGSSDGSSNNLLVPRPRSASLPDPSTKLPPFSIAELEAPSAAVLRSRSMSDGNHLPYVINSHNTAPNLSRISDRSLHASLRSSPATSRPWNVDANYPWATTVPSIDISLPAPTLRRDAVTQRPSKLRLRLSRDASTNSDPATDFGSVLTALAEVTESTGGVTSDTFSNNHRRKLSKRSLLGSIGRKIGLGNSIDQGGFATGPDILRGEDRTVDPGDRYPTTGLSPPAALNIDEVRSFFSDDSSAHGEAANRGVSFRKRLTNFRTRLPPISRAHSALEHRTVTQESSNLRRSNSLFVPNVENQNTRDTSPAIYPGGVVGMPKSEFRAKKLVEKMKSLWYRSGELLRSLSGKKKQGNKVQQAWDETGEDPPWNNV
ncbi:hypothetical protein EJ08DRAFT_650378, partial [Tothia fuscella]